MDWIKANASSQQRIEIIAEICKLNEDLKKVETIQSTVDTFCKQNPHLYGCKYAKMGRECIGRERDIIKQELDVLVPGWQQELSSGSSGSDTGKVIAKVGIGLFGIYALMRVMGRAK